MGSDFFQSAGNPRGGLFAKDTTGTEITNVMNLFLFSSKPALQRAPFWSDLFPAPSLHMKLWITIAQ